MNDIKTTEIEQIKYDIEELRNLSPEIGESLLFDKSQGLLWALSEFTRKSPERFNSLLTTIESQKEEIDKLNMFREDYRKTALERIAYQEKQIDSLKAITELAVKGLKQMSRILGMREIDDLDIGELRATSDDALSEIEKLQNV